MFSFTDHDAKGLHISRDENGVIDIRVRTGDTFVNTPDHPCHSLVRLFPDTDEDTGLAVDVPIIVADDLELTDSEGRTFSVGDYWDSTPADVAVNRTMLGDLIACRSYLEDDSRSPRRRAALLASVNEAIEAGTRGVRLEDRPVNDLAVQAIDAMRKIARGTDYGPGADPNLTTDEIHRLAVSVVDAANDVAAGGAV